MDCMPQWVEAVLGGKRGPNIYSMAIDNFEEFLKFGFTCYQILRVYMQTLTFSI